MSRIGYGVIKNIYNNFINELNVIYVTVLAKIVLKFIKSDEVN